MRVVVRTNDGKVHAYQPATARVTTAGALVIHDELGRRLAVYPRGRATSYDLRPDDDREQ